MTEPTEPSRIIGTAEAADILGWSQRKVQRQVNTRPIPIIRDKVGGRVEYLFDRDVIEHLAEELDHH